jgi:hypothetical protein
MSIISFFGLNRTKRAKQVRDFVMKEYFNSASQKKAITKAARESAEDQQIMMKRYRELVR